MDEEQERPVQMAIEPSAPADHKYQKAQGISKKKTPKQSIAAASTRQMEEFQDPEDLEIARLEKLLGVKKDGNST